MFIPAALVCVAASVNEVHSAFRFFHLLYVLRVVLMFVEEGETSSIQAGLEVEHWLTSSCG